MKDGLTLFSEVPWDCNILMGYFGGPWMHVLQNEYMICFSGTSNDSKNVSTNSAKSMRSIQIGNFNTFILGKLCYEFKLTNRAILRGSNILKIWKILFPFLLPLPFLYV